MELKSRKQARYQQKLQCFNRTFMELKLKKTHAQVENVIVLIVPLWN